MHIAIAQLNYHVGNLKHNSEKILAALQEGKNSGVDLMVFAEMALTGYPAKDLWVQPDFVREVEQALNRIAAACTGIACIIGVPLPNRTGKGKPLFNAAVLLYDGRIQGTASKGLIPDYDVFDEFRYFQPNEAFSCLEFQGLKLAVTICEDLWYAYENQERSSLYTLDPMGQLASEKPDLLINIAASPFAVGHAETRQTIMRKHSLKSGVPLIYVNQVGAHADLIFDGRSMIWSAEGELVSELAAFKEELAHFHFENKALIPEKDSGPKKDWVDMALVHQALLLGIRDYFQKSGFKKAVLGLSGGLDSAVVAALAIEALGPKNVLAVLMPSEYSTDHSLKDARDLVENTGCDSLLIPISQPVNAFEQVLSPAFDGRKPDTTEENIQARSRGLILMALSNKLGHVLLNTSNKSEAAVGYGTLYGDMAGAISVIGDLFKTDVYRLADYINREREIIPINTIRKPPSAELRPDQKDSDSLPDYSYLDAVLRAYVEENRPIEAIKTEWGDPIQVDRIIGMVDRAEFKRYQTPPTLRVSKKAFGPGRLMPLVMRKDFT